MADQNTADSPALQAIRAQAYLHHQYLLGLQLMIATRCDRDVTGDWMFRLFRRQHLDKFLSSFNKLGLSDLPHAVACARYHVLSNNIGGVGVEYFEESDRKAWVRFRYPRWMYDGPTICGVPVETSRGFLRGWYAQNGVSLNNPRLGYVCVSEDMTGEFGLCGYFYEYDHDLADDERLQFAKDELPPPFVEGQQPKPPEGEWNLLRLEKANRNYAMDYIRNGLCELAGVIGIDETLEHATRAARLIGLQCFSKTASDVGAPDGDVGDAARYLATMFSGMGDTTEVHIDEESAVVRHGGLRIVRGLEGTERSLVLDCWEALWRGALSAQREVKQLTVIAEGESLIWRIEALTNRSRL